MLCLDHLLRSLMPRTSRPVTVTLGDLQQRVKARVKSGAYASVSEVMRAAVRALEREEAAVNEWLRQRVDDAFADPRPNVPGERLPALISTGSRRLAWRSRPCLNGAHDGMTFARAFGLWASSVARRLCSR